MPKKVLLIACLVENGLCPDEKEARARVMAGEVYVNGQRAVGGMKVSPDDEITLRGAPFAGKGALKLAGALDDFRIDVAGRVCVDAGASTGGFTDCLVSRGAKTVYAVDVGYGQLVGRLRQDARVVNLEKTNISDDKLLSLSPPPTLGTVDLSYLSLRRGVPYFRAILRGQGELVCLVKPLFETDDMEARRTGALSASTYAPLLNRLIDDLNAQENTFCENVTNSAVTGNAGTIEFFLHVRLGARRSELPDGAIDAAVARALALTRYRK